MKSVRGDFMGKHFTLRDRYIFESLLNKVGYSFKQLSQYFNKSLKTIYNEYYRGLVTLLDSELREYTIYQADVAQRKYENNMSNCGRNLLIGNNLELASRLDDLMYIEKYSPYSAYQIVKQERNDINFCLSTLINYRDNDVLLHTSKELRIYKMSKKTREKRQGKKNNAHKQLIDDRDREVLKRDSFGHWELDTVVGKQGSKQVLLVLTERKTRFEVIYRMNSKECNSTWDTLINLKNKLGDTFYNYFKSITCDNGVEFSQNSDVLMNDVDFNIFIKNNLFYCHPYRSNERGSNENANRLIRRFINKGEDISDYTDEYIKYIQDWINTLPRRMFNGKSSLDMLRLNI